MVKHLVTASVSVQPESGSHIVAATALSGPIEHAIGSLKQCCNRLTAVIAARQSFEVIQNGVVTAVWRHLEHRPLTAYSATGARAIEPLIGAPDQITKRPDNISVGCAEIN